MGETDAVSDLCNLLQIYWSKVVLLSETKQSVVEMGLIKEWLGDFRGLYDIYVDADGRSRGLTMLWLDSIDLQFLSSSSRHMNVSIH